MRQLIEEKKIELFFVEGAENPADLFTKSLGATKFLKFREQLGLEFYLYFPSLRCWRLSLALSDDA